MASSDVLLLRFRSCASAPLECELGLATLCSVAEYDRSDGCHFKEWVIKGLWFPLGASCSLPWITSTEIKKPLCVSSPVRKLWAPRGWDNPTPAMPGHSPKRLLCPLLPQSQSSAVTALTLQLGRPARTLPPTGTAAGPAFELLPGWRRTRFPYLDLRAILCPCWQQRSKQRLGV